MTTITTFDVREEPLIIECSESSTPVYTATLLDENSTAIAASAIDEIVMTLIDARTGEVVNSREEQDIKNANDCTIHATSGLFTWNIQIEDTELQASPLIGAQYEEHVASITVRWNSTKQMHRTIALRCYDLASVPQ